MPITSLGYQFATPLAQQVRGSRRKAVRVKTGAEGTRSRFRSHKTRQGSEGPPSRRRLPEDAGLRRRGRAASGTWLRLFGVVQGRTVQPLPGEAPTGLFRKRGQSRSHGNGPDPDRSGFDPGP